MLEKHRDVRIAHAHASIGDRLPDQVFFVRSMDVDEPAQRIDTIASVDPMLQSLKPQNAGEHPVRVGEALTQRFIEDFARPAATTKNRPWRAARADLQADAVRAVRGLERSCSAPESPCGRRHWKSKDLPGSLETGQFLARDIQMQVLDFGHREGHFPLT